jgi:hypothetical protein
MAPAAPKRVRRAAGAEGEPKRKRGRPFKVKQPEQGEEYHDDDLVPLPLTGNWNGAGDEEANEGSGGGGGSSSSAGFRPMDDQQAEEQEEGDEADEAD